MEIYRRQDFVLLGQGYAFKIYRRHLYTRVVLMLISLGQPISLSLSLTFLGSYTRWKHVHFSGQCVTNPASDCEKQPLDALLFEVPDNKFHNKVQDDNSVFEFWTPLFLYLCSLFVSNLNRKEMQECMASIHPRDGEHILQCWILPFRFFPPEQNY